MKETIKTKFKHELQPEVTKFINEYFGLIRLRDVYVKLPFGFKKAKKCAIGAEKAREKFWRKVRELYPELADHEITYHGGNYTISAKVKE